MTLVGASRRADTTATGAVLRLDRVAETFGTKRTVDDVSLIVAADGYVSLLGAGRLCRAWRPLPQQEA